MAVGIYFPVQGMTAETYDKIIEKLDAAGASAPAGRSYHVAFAVGGEGLHVFDVWDSEESFAAFGETMLPIAAEHGIELPEPSVSPVHNIVIGS